LMWLPQRNLIVHIARTNPAADLVDGHPLETRRRSLRTIPAGEAAGSAPDQLPDAFPTAFCVVRLWWRRWRRKRAWSTPFCRIIRALATSARARPSALVTAVVISRITPSNVGATPSWHRASASAQTLRGWIFGQGIKTTDGHPSTRILVRCNAVFLLRLAFPPFAAGDRPTLIGYGEQVVCAHCRERCLALLM
jgi:hypothetical protein